MTMTTALLLVATAYAAGAIPASHWTGLLHGKDLRTLGSCNLGATNVQRVLGWGAAIPVGLFDIFKGFAPVWWFPAIDGQSGEGWAIAYAAAAILGHCYSFWVDFRGGKGVATSAGALIALAPLAVAVGVVVWLAVLFGARKVSVASMAAAVSVPVAGFAATDARGALLGFLTGMAIFVVLAHRSNIRRLMAGEEPSIGRRRGAGGGEDGDAGTDEANGGSG